jgi:hypothetical protein
LSNHQSQASVGALFFYACHIEWVVVIKLI